MDRRQTTADMTAMMATRTAPTPIAPPTWTATTVSAVVEISDTHPLSKAATVHELNAAGRIRGKVLLTPA